MLKRTCFHSRLNSGLVLDAVISLALLILLYGSRWFKGGLRGFYVDPCWSSFDGPLVRPGHEPSRLEPHQEKARAFLGSCPGLPLVSLTPLVSEAFPSL